MLILRRALSSTAAGIILIGSALILPLWVTRNSKSGPAGVREWRYYGGDLAGTRYSALDQVNRANVSRLKVAWAYHTGEKRYRSSKLSNVRNPKTTPEDVAAGAKIFHSQCALCHGPDGKGGRAPDLTQMRFKYGGTDAALFSTVFEGIPNGGMPGIYAADDKVWQVVAFLRSLRTAEQNAADAPAKGEQVRSGWGAGARWATIECTPIILDDVMYITTLFSKVTALDAATGRPLWIFDPYEDDRFHGYNRGVNYWQEADEKRIYFTAGNRLFALDAKTGQPISSFGEKGSIDLTKGLDREVNEITVTSPGVIYKNLLVLGSSTYAGFAGRQDEGAERKPAPGHVRAFDIHTGKRAWIFHTIPHPGEFGYDTWPPDAWKTATGANSWGGMTLDERRGLVFLGTAAPYYKPPRYGMNLFANSVIALKAATGERVWHFQTLHHDVWDLDIPCPPNLVTVEHGGRKIDAVAQVGKIGMLFLLDRETGKPLFPVEERPVPASDLNGETLWPTQPFPVKPPPYSRQKFTEEDVTNISPEARAYVMERLAKLRPGRVYEPPSKQGTIVYPGIHGGNNWGGASFDPTTGRLYVNSNEIPWVFHGPSTGFQRFEDQNGYPAVKPPWGNLNAIDLNKGEIVWQVPLGEFKELAAKGILPTGTENLGGTIVTAGGLVFVGATKDEKFRAFDKTTGKLLWEADLEAVAYATPSTYEVDGKQYIVIAAGGGGGVQSDSILDDAAGAQQGHRRRQPGDAFVAFTLR